MSTSLLRGSVKELRFQRFALRVLDGLDKGKEHVCTSAAEVSVGTAESNALVLSDPTVSRYHFVLQVDPQGVQLRDLGSTNGTTLGGFRVGSAYLKSGAVLTVGMTRIRYDEMSEQLDEPLSDDEFFGRALGRSVAMRRLFSVLPRIAATDSTVLIEGETGTGKGVLAEAIHTASSRAQKPLVVVDCGSIPPSLIESELFGHEKGAFTG
ncbi:MAG TPA: FHA domain-containing protein, partial [Kofleriaceae bacterium]|nr:FHA domain-containing protein [Kofleriaceae bacterium]